MLYDSANRLTGSIDYEGNLTQYLLDAVGRTTGMIDALSQLTAYSYDLRGSFDWRANHPRTLQQGGVIPQEGLQELPKIISR